MDKSHDNSSDGATNDPGTDVLVATLYFYHFPTEDRAPPHYFSERVYEILGYRPEGLIGRTPFDLMEEGEIGRAHV